MIRVEQIKVCALFGGGFDVAGCGVSDMPKELQLLGYGWPAYIVGVMNYLF